MHTCKTTRDFMLNAHKGLFAMVFYTEALILAKIFIR